MTDLDRLIALWEDFFVWTPPDLETRLGKLVTETITALEELKKLKGE